MSYGVLIKNKHTGIVQFVKGVGYGLEEGEIGVGFLAETRVSFVLQRPKRF